MYICMENRTNIEFSWLRIRFAVAMFCPDVDEIFHNTDVHILVAATSHCVIKVLFIHQLMH